MEVTLDSYTHTDPGVGGTLVEEKQEEKHDNDEFGLRYRPQLDAYFLQPWHKGRAKTLTPVEAWIRQTRSCSHPRWHRENFLGSTYFTCMRCGWRRQQALPPSSGTLSLQDAERLFRARYPRRHDAPPQEQYNADVIRQWQELVRQERHPAEVARAVCARDMLQSDVYQRVAAQVHAAAHLDSDVHVLARRYTAALQVLQSRLTRMCHGKARQRKAKGGFDKGEKALVGKATRQDGRKKGQTGGHNVRARDKVLGGYFYACVALRRTVFLDGKTFKRLQLVHQRLRYLFPGLPRDLPTHTYLAALTPRLFPRLTADQRRDLKARALSMIYATAREGIKEPKRSLVCCSLLAAAVEAKKKVSKKDMAFLMNFDSHHKKWSKVMALLGRLPESEVQESEEEQTRLEELLDEEEPVPDPACDLLKEKQKQERRRTVTNEASVTDDQNASKKWFTGDEAHHVDGDEEMTGSE